MVPPWYSSGLSFLVRARVARSFTASLISRRDFFWESRMTGVTRPSSTATATLRFTLPYWMMASPAKLALTAGTFTAAATTAFRTKSFTVNFVPPAASLAALASARNFIKGAAFTSMLR